MRTVEEYIEHVKTQDEMYHHVIEGFEKQKPARSAVHNEFSHVVTYSDYFPNLDEMEDWCHNKFGDEHGECKWDSCEWSFSKWHIESGLRKELDTLLYETPKPERDTPEFELWGEYHSLILEAHYDMIKNDIIDKPWDHCHKGTWRSYYIIKTGYDYGYQDFCFKNIEDAIYFKLIWDEISNK